MEMATKQEIEDGIRGIVRPDEWEMGDDLKYEIVWNGSDLKATVTQMYSYVVCNLAELKALSELCGTDHINLDKDRFGGCETCDYGSRYEIDIFIKGVKIDPAIAQELAHEQA